MRNNKLSTKALLCAVDELKRWPLSELNGLNDREVAERLSVKVGASYTPFNIAHIRREQIVEGWRGAAAGSAPNVRSLARRVSELEAKIARLEDGAFARQLEMDSKVAAWPRKNGRTEATK